MNTPVNYVEALLIGGPHDGKRVNIAEGIPQLAMPDPQRRNPIAYRPDNFLPINEEAPIHHYTRSGFGITHEGRRGMFYLYIHESLPAHPIAAVQMLYDGYRKPGETPKWDHDLTQLPRNPDDWRGW